MLSEAKTCPQLLQCFYLSHFKSDLHTVRRKVGLLLPVNFLLHYDAVVVVQGRGYLLIVHLRRPYVVVQLRLVPLGSQSCG